MPNVVSTCSMTTMGNRYTLGRRERRLRARIGRHLTNQRTDAVAMNVLDPFEVADVEVYPFYDLERPQKGETEAVCSARVEATLAAAEYTVFQKVLKESALKAVLNEADVPKKDPIRLPASVRDRIIPADLYQARKHPDTRIARRASTIASLARVISERDVSPGLRQTLLTQARRLERLSRQRLKDFKAFPVEQLGQETEEAAVEEEES